VVLELLGGGVCKNGHAYNVSDYLDRNELNVVRRLVLLGIAGK
jgi:hypothetical protein